MSSSGLIKAVHVTILLSQEITTNEINSLNASIHLFVRVYTDNAVSHIYPTGR